MAGLSILLSAALIFATTAVVHAEASISASSADQATYANKNPPPSKWVVMMRGIPRYLTINDVITQSEPSGPAPGLKRKRIRLVYPDPPSHLTPERVHGGIQ
jgi:hypothetical protein